MSSTLYNSLVSLKRAPISTESKVNFLIDVLLEEFDPHVPTSAPAEPTSTKPEPKSEPKPQPVASKATEEKHV